MTPAMCNLVLNALNLTQALSAGVALQLQPWAIRRARPDFPLRIQIYSTKSLQNPDLLGQGWGHICPS